MSSTPFETLIIARECEHERKEAVTAHMKSLALDFTFLSASEPPDSLQEALSFGYSPERAIRTKGRQLAPTEIGCFASHRRAWKRASNTARPTLILESDALVKPDGLEAIITAGAFKRPNWDAIVLYYHKCIPSFWYQSRINPFFRLVKFSNKKIYGAAAYVITPEGANKLLKNAANIELPADDYLMGNKIYNNMNLYALYPMAITFSPYAEQSNIEMERKRMQNEHPNDSCKKKKAKKGGRGLKDIFIALKKPPFYR